MKRKDMIGFSIVFLLCVLAAGQVVNMKLTGNNIFGSNETPKLQNAESLTCSENIAGSRPATNDPQLKAIPEYEKVCKSAFLDDMMIFTDMPISNPTAKVAADKMALRLKEFNSQHITPIVIVEPDSEWGLVDFQEYASGRYDEWTATYFAELKQNNITDAMMGLWIPFPEPQQPTWNNSSPDNFAYSVNRYFKALRQVFPSGKTGILLDSQAGETDKASQLVAYTRLIDNSLVDVAGLQGFPWHPSEEGDKRAPLITADEFAPAYLLDEVAKSLDTHEVLLNIGSYRHRKAENGGDIAVTTVERQTTLRSIADEASQLKIQGYKLTVNIFSENKLNTKEGVDWSYWKAGDYTNSSQTSLFTDFVSRLKKDGSKISIYDSRP